MKASTFTFRMEMKVEFAHPVTIQQGREWARRMLDTLDLDAVRAGVPEELDEVSVKCAELRRLLRVKIREEP